MKSYNETLLNIWPLLWSVKKFWWSQRFLFCNSVIRPMHKPLSLHLEKVDWICLILAAPLCRSLQEEPRAYWWPAKHTETSHTSEASNTLKCKPSFTGHRVRVKACSCQRKSWNHFRVLLLFPQPCTCERPRSFWQSGTLFWDEAGSHSSRQENYESGCEGEREHA